jgi:hypothetical protein
MGSLQVMLRDGKQGANLYIHVHEGTYRLYCQVFGFDLQERIPGRIGETQITALRFPLVVTDTPALDGLLPNTKGGLTIHAHGIPPLVETYRGEDGRLYVKLADIE